MTGAGHWAVVREMPPFRWKVLSRHRWRWAATCRAVVSSHRLVKHAAWVDRENQRPIVARLVEVDEPPRRSGTIRPSTYWRVGRKVGRTVYLQVGPEPSDGDALIGMFDTPELAQEAVERHNAVTIPAEEPST